MAELKLYVPLLVHLNEPGMAWNSLNELEEENGAFHTDVISEAVKKSMEAYGERGLAEKLNGPMTEKIISAMPGVEEHNGALYGTITFVSTEELTNVEIAGMKFWTYQEFGAGWGNDFANTPIEVEDGEIYVRYSNDMYDYILETAEEFFGNTGPKLEPIPPKFSLYDAELIATYEEVYKIPEENKVTSWWGDMHLYEFKYEAEPEKIAEAFEKSLKAVGMTKAEFNDYRYTYRQSLINKMEENMPEKYQVITLFNKPVLMSEGRVDAQNVPPDYYAYELRHDEGGDIATLEKSVRVDFGGTILSRDEIEIVGDHRKIDYDDYNFLSIDYSVDEFDEHYDELVDEYCEPEIENGMTMG